MKDQAKAMDSDHEQVAKVKLLASRDFEVSYPSSTEEAIQSIYVLRLISWNGLRIQVNITLLYGRILSH
jgi:predicted ATP-grasp superfamily ATP-dependent carboligase